MSVNAVFCEKRYLRLERPVIQGWPSGNAWQREEIEVLFFHAFQRFLCARRKNMQAEQEAKPELQKLRVCYSVTGVGGGKVCIVNAGSGHSSRKQVFFKKRKSGFRHKIYTVHFFRLSFKKENFKRHELP